MNDILGRTMNRSSKKYRFQLASSLRNPQRTHREFVKYVYKFIDQPH